jgi:hypothetical protein
MSVLEFAPKSFFTMRSYRVFRDGAPIGEIDCGGMREGATISIGGTSYTTAREGLMSGPYYLEANGNRLASAERASAWRGGFTVQAGGRTYLLRAASMFARAFVLTENGVAVGSIARHGFFIVKNKAELPDDMALEVKAFLFWLVILTSQRQMLTAVVVGSAAGGR